MIELREVRTADLTILFRHQLDPEACAMAAFAARSWPDFDAHWTRVLADPSIVKRTIVADHEIAGNAVCFGDSDERKVAYWLGREFWGRADRHRRARAVVV
jgi:hypothetical protein